MHPDFWHERWRTKQIGFHEGKPNDDLVAVWPRLGLRSGVRVLVPLCGKTHDLQWIHARGHQVVGVELSELACAAFFAEHSLTPSVEKAGPYQSWSVPGLTLLQGDVFDLPETDPFDVVWDRAATVALPDDLRRRYANKLAHVTRPGGTLLLSVFVYPQSERAGPPFAVPPEHVEALFGENFHIERQHRPADPSVEADMTRLKVSRASIDLYWLTRSARPASPPPSLPG
ncbi:MAG: methyltransferase domain-containing protein [Myxococcales bacterium]|nr:methyltransferase domain-containing protein [Myxococcales bacterium]